MIMTVVRGASPPMPSRDREQRDPEPLMQLDVAAGHACAVGADPAFGASEPARAGAIGTLPHSPACERLASRASDARDGRATSVRRRAIRPRAAPASVKRQRRRRRYRVSCDAGTADGLLLVFRSKMELRAGRECCKQAVSSTHHERRVAQIEGRLHLVCGAAGGRASESGAGDGIQSSAGAAIGAASLLLWEMSSRAETGPPGNDH